MFFPIVFVLGIILFSSLTDDAFAVDVPVAIPAGTPPNPCLPNLCFTPDVAVVNQFDTVTWTNNGGSHTSTSGSPGNTDNRWDSGIIAPGVVGWWPGDGDGNDISGNAQNGIVKGGVTFPKGKVDRAFKFDGIDGRIEISDSPILKFGTGDLTIDAWIKAPQGTGFRTFIGKEQQSFPFPSVIFRLDPDGKIEFAATDCGTGGCGWRTSRLPVKSPIRVDDNAFHHVAGVRHSSGYELYVDGQLVATRSEPARNSDNSAPLFIGVQNTTKLPFKGIVDEVEIYDRVLSASEIQAIFKAGSRGNKPTKMVSICHKPGTPAQETLVIPFYALSGHLGHGDTIGSCEE